MKLFPFCLLGKHDEQNNFFRKWKIRLEEIGKLKNYLRAKRGNFMGAKLLGAENI